MKRNINEFLKEFHAELNEDESSLILAFSQTFSLNGLDKKLKALKKEAKKYDLQLDIRATYVEGNHVIIPLKNRKEKFIKIKDITDVNLSEILEDPSLGEFEAIYIETPKWILDSMSAIALILKSQKNGVARPAQGNVDPWEAASKMFSDDNNIDYSSYETIVLKEPRTIKKIEEAKKYLNYKPTLIANKFYLTNEFILWTDKYVCITKIENRKITLIGLPRHP